MFDVAIIGAGPAGASAGLIIAKAGKQTVVFDNGKSMTKRALVKNYYGLPEITGPALVETGKQQLRTMGAEIVEAHVDSIGPIEGGFRIQAGDRPYEARHVVIATGVALDLAERVGLQTKPGTEPRIKTVLEVAPDGRTALPGIWAAGTIAGVSVHVAITAGDGAKVAINLLSELNGERYVDHDVLPAQA
ncbi:MAG TPA: FAD-dependent oxidoreductase [Stenomitos sp.]